MTCTEFISLLDDLMEENVATSIRTEIETHMHECEHCEVVFNTTRKTIEIYRSHDIYELPNDLRERLHSAIMSRCKKGC